MNVQADKPLVVCTWRYILNAPASNSASAFGVVKCNLNLFCLAADINLGLIRYVLSEDRVQETMDNFKFLVKDSKPNIVSDNVFHIQWSLISFEHKRCACLEFCSRSSLHPTNLFMLWTDEINS